MSYELINKRKPNMGAAPNRASYSPSNAETFRPIFDKMIDTMKDVVLTEKETGYRMNTLFLKANDALKWLVENHANKDKYALFRTRVVITRLLDSSGIEIKYKQSIATVLQRAAAIGIAVTWKDQFEEWVKTAKAGDIFERNGVVVTPDQKDFVIDFMFQLNSETSEVEITGDRVKVMR